MKKTFYIAVAILAFTACNKDDVIVDGGDDNSRPAIATSSPYQTAVFEYTPAPGQFINDTKTGGFNGEETTAALAAEYAMRRLSNRQFVSLGAFGGYIVVGFDHSISNNGGYDFAIEGNAFDSSNEPGIVWVMQDTNCNGLPDDVWYELRGSETGKEGTIQQYSVTYYRPSAAGENVRWVDVYGNEGYVEYLKAYHKQDSYYPLWMSGVESYTLTGTRLEARNSKDPETGMWSNAPFSWGYADNMGTDCLTADSSDGAGQKVGFKISNAIDEKGNAVNLKYIDFIKVQSAVLAQSGWLGENSCEVFSFIDLSLVK